MQITAKGPLLKALVALAQNMIKRSPIALLRWLPGARSMLMRGFGEASLHEVAGGADLVIRGCYLAMSPSYRAAHSGILLGTLDDAGATGYVMSSGYGDDVTFHVRWDR